MITSSERSNKIAETVVFALALFGLVALFVFGDCSVLSEGAFYVALLFTLLRSLIAFSASFIFALIAALLSGKEWVRIVLSPLITVVRSMPTMAAVLIFILRFNANVTTVLVGVLVLFPTFYSALLPARLKVDGVLIEVARVYGANRLQTLKNVILPSMLPAIVENATAGLSLSLKLIVSSEVLTQAAKSVGMFMQSARAYLELDRLIFLTAFIIVLCIIIEKVGKLAYKLTIKYQ